MGIFIHGSLISDFFTIVKNAKLKTCKIFCIKLFKTLNSGYDKGKLSISQQRGTITLIPKEDASLLLLQNWHPRTLLNVDYKIASKAIAKRLELLLPKLIYPDRTCFIKGRYIGENIRLISNIVDIFLKQKLPGILISLDFQKAFDSLKWPFMQRVLELFNFGVSINNWIKVSILTSKAQ